LKSSHRYDENRDSDEEEEHEEDQNDPFKTGDPFADPANNPLSASGGGGGGGFDAIIGNNNISSNHHHLLYGYQNNGVFDHSNDFLMNFYASQCSTTNYPFTATTNTPPSSYNPFHHNFINHHQHLQANEIENDDNNCNNDNWATFNSSPDNFADFDSHFASMTPVEVPEMNIDDATTPTNPPSLSTDAIFDPYTSNGDQTTTTTCFVATTQVIEISSAPPTAATAVEEPHEEEELAQETASKREFQLGPNVVNNNNIINPIDSIIQKTIPALDELDDEEFFSLRDDSNEMSSLTDDTDRKLINNENTEIPDDDDDDFASADER
jgi:hypothetical protein